MVDYSKYFDEPAGSAPPEFVPPIGTYVVQAVGEVEGRETAAGGAMAVVHLKVISAEDDALEAIPDGVLPSSTRLDATFMMTEDFGKRQWDQFLDATGVHWNGLSRKEATDLVIREGAQFRCYVNKHRDLKDGRKTPNISKFLPLEG